jgi:hypothetical protein
MALASGPPDPTTVRCPTCRASQDWSETCRRCRSDLRLLREFAEGYHRARRDCLHHLQAGRHRAARAAALRCHALAPSAESLRLLAIASLWLHDWETAASAGRKL